MKTRPPHHILQSFRLLRPWTLMALLHLCTGIAASAGQPLPEAVQGLLRQVGLRYQVTADPELQRCLVPRGLSTNSIDTILITLLGSQGAGYDMKSAQEMHLFVLDRPWNPPQTPGAPIPEAYARQRSRVNIPRETPVHRAVEAIRNAFGLPLVLDYRIDPGRTLNASIQDEWLENLLNKLKETEGWTWRVEDSILFLLPGPVEKLIGLPNRDNQTWIYADSPLSDVVGQIETTFGIEIRTDAEISERLITGSLQGERLGNVLDRLADVGELTFQTEAGSVLLGPQGKYARGDASRLLAKKVRIRLDILEIPQRQWKELSIDRFLIQVPQPTPEETEQMWNKATRTSGNRIFGRADTIISSGTIGEIEFPIPVGKGREPSPLGPPGYFFKIRPMLPRPEIVQLDLSMVFRDTVEVRDGRIVFVPSLFEKPVSASVITPSGQRVLIHGAIRFVEKDLRNFFLISFVPEVVGEDAPAPTVEPSAPQERGRRTRR